MRFAKALGVVIVVAVLAAMAAAIHSQRVELNRVEARQAATTRPRAALVSAAARTAKPCPFDAARCVTTPYKDGPYGPGSAGQGLAVIGSKGFGGTPFAVYDTERGKRLKDGRRGPLLHAAEVWISDGTLWIAMKPGWLGRGLCITGDGFKDVQCLSATDIAKMHADGM